MSIKSAVYSTLTAPRPAGGDSGSAVSDTLNDMVDGVGEIERYARQSDPRNVALFAKLSQLKVELQAAAQSAEAGRARLGATLRGPSPGTSGSPNKSPF